MGINNWKLEDRPREKMYVSGAASLSDSELLAILINSGTRNHSAHELARELLARADNSLNRLTSLPLRRMCSIQGIGKAKAARITAALELGARAQSELQEPQMRITASSSVFRIFSPILRSLRHEECWVLFLNRANRVIDKERISVGGLSATVMDPRVIMKKAVERLACSIILVHNHPSGNPAPSEMDRRQTHLLKDAAQLLDISLLDHVIIAGDKYFSFCDEGL